ncbi:MAG: hypothetical protein M0Z87_05425 [Actinomycetota bacterium]|nr:hypothetical protein [Actinomycetota bacterium]
MSRDPIGRKVARAAATGGRKRSSRGQAPVGWYGSLATVVVLGVAVVGYSRYEVAHPASAVQPTVGQHWLAAVGFDVCGKTEPNLAAPPKSARSGITTLGDGLIHINPTNSTNAGANATLGRFVAGYPGLVLTGSELQLPGHKAHHNGGTCSGRPARLVVDTWSSLVSTRPTQVANPLALRLKNGQLITVAFVPSGAAVPKPASRFALAGAAASTTQAPTKPTGVVPTTPGGLAPVKTPSTGTNGTKSTGSSVPGSSTGSAGTKSTGTKSSTKAAG